MVKENKGLRHLINQTLGLLGVQRSEATSWLFGQSGSKQRQVVDPFFETGERWSVSVLRGERCWCCFGFCVGQCCAGCAGTRGGRGGGGAGERASPWEDERVEETRKRESETVPSKCDPEVPGLCEHILDDGHKHHSQGRFLQSPVQGPGTEDQGLIMPQVGI